MVINEKKGESNLGSKGIQLKQYIEMLRTMM